MTLYWQDHPSRYGIISRLLHWGMAALFFWQFMGMAIKLIVGRAPLTAFMVSTHKPIGFLLLTLGLLRVLWALAQRHQRPYYKPTGVGWLALSGHLILYVLMLVVPSIALLRQYGTGDGYELFGVQLMAATGNEIAWMLAPADLLHGLLAWTLMALVAGHIFMVLVHRLKWRDDVLSRMVGKHHHQL